MIKNTFLFRSFLKHRYAIIGAITGLVMPAIKSLGDYYLFSPGKIGFFVFLANELKEPQQLFDYALLTIIPVLIMGAAGILFAKFVHAQHISFRDPLTGAYNKRYLALTENRLRKKRGMFTLAMIDLDNFKSVNDKFGHAAGDEALKKVYQIVEEEKRKEDTIIRYGGDEFVMILPDSTSASAKKILNRIRKRVSKIQYGDTRLGFSMGVVLEKESEHTNLHDLIKLADKRMYKDKEKKHER